MVRDTLLGRALYVVGSKVKDGKGIENNSSREGNLNDNPLEISTISMNVKINDQVGCCVYVKEKKYKSEERFNVIR